MRSMVFKTSIPLNVLLLQSLTHTTLTLFIAVFIDRNFIVYVILTPNRVLLTLTHIYRQKWQNKAQLICFKMEILLFYPILFYLTILWWYVYRIFSFYICDVLNYSPSPPPVFQKLPYFHSTNLTPILGNLSFLIEVRDFSLYSFIYSLVCLCVECKSQQSVIIRYCLSLLYLFHAT